MSKLQIHEHVSRVCLMNFEQHQRLVSKRELVHKVKFFFLTSVNLDNSLNAISFKK